MSTALPPTPLDVMAWLRDVLRDYRFDIAGLLRDSATPPAGWPLIVASEADLVSTLRQSASLLPLPTESAALAHLMEVSLVAFLLQRLRDVPGAAGRGGTARSYPDLEISGPAFGVGHHAIDIKAARRNKTGRATKSRITLYTANTYFKHPSERFPGMTRAFGDYASHVDVLAIFTYDALSHAHVRDLRLLVHEPWRIASRQRSSTTRNYIGAVTSIRRLAAGQGAFNSAQAFYDYWRAYDFKATAARRARSGPDTEDPQLPLDW
jgi:Restriction endonuclease EcoRV